MHADRYPIPAARHRTEQVIQRSRFIATVAPAESIEAATAFVREIGAEFPDATHNCWAYVVGPPGSTGRVGMSDDGEPHGTAGRPMLTVLLHGGLGDVAAVVTRYYGGTKLGTGGLVRAYGGALQEALLAVPRRDRVDYVPLRVAVDYASVTPAQQAIAAAEGVMDDESFGTEAVFTVRVPATQVEALHTALMDATRGRARVERLDAEDAPDAPDAPER